VLYLDNERKRWKFDPDTVTQLATQPLRHFKFSISSGRACVFSAINHKWYAAKKAELKAQYAREEKLTSWKPPLPNCPSPRIAGAILTVQ